MNNNQIKLFVGKFRKHTIKIITLSIFVLLLSIQIFAQVFQSSGYIRFNPNRPATTTPPPPTTNNISTIERGKGYLTITMLDGRVYNKQPLKYFWKDDRKLVSLFTTEGTLGGILLNQGKGKETPSPNKTTMDTIKNGAPYSLNWQNIVLVDTIPCDFNNLTLTTRINTTSKNGFDEIFDTMQMITSFIPSLTTNVATQGVMSGTKNVIDMLVAKKLDQPTILQTRGINYGNETGYYVNFASDDPKAWSQYQQNAQNLFWRNNTLMYLEGQQEVEVKNVSYIILEVKVTEPWKSYDSFEKFRINVFNREEKDRPWQSDFNKAYAISQIQEAATSDSLKNNIRTLVEDGKRKLREDVSVASNDKLAIIALVDEKFSQTAK